MTDTAQIPVCQTPNCVNAVTTIGAQGAVRLPHPVRPDCHPEGTPVGSGQRANVRPLRDDPTVTNEDGGSQSVIPTTFGTLPLTALRMLARLQKLGDDKYGPHNWRSIPEHEHINHAFEHMLLHCTGDRSDDHLLHAAWRLVAAVEVRATKSTYYDEKEEGLDDDD